MLTIVVLFSYFVLLYFVQPIYINEGRINNRNTSLYNAVQLNDVTNYNLQNGH